MTAQVGGIGDANNRQANDSGTPLLDAWLAIALARGVLPTQWRQIEPILGARRRKRGRAVTWLLSRGPTRKSLRVFHLRGLFDKAKTSLADTNNCVYAARASTRTYCQAMARCPAYWSNRPVQSRKLVTEGILMSRLPKSMPMQHRYAIVTRRRHQSFDQENTHGLSLSLTTASICWVDT